MNKRLTVFTIVVRTDEDIDPSNWSVYAIDSKGGYLDDVVSYSSFTIEEN